ncbi:MAG: T9SS type A sorting domain-containing protein [Balneola sp.]|nr:T9SS type A sorting domain-containing protein [Balneola sp.]MBO6651615.1 T9SS type A sorting domain-containing protein [Balneola sp.]MBO6710719.1 T9SS type A sorting domain-containing protein [Balneola sp.]MBO6799405.1 T9SS type A sorting domain-containing protein [Balneola sp.]MBO6869466.1 T9SS type A sorting domain-containing protein [Balneola sp.]
MKLLKATILIIFLGTVGANISAQTSISGNITTNTTWTTAGSPYVIVGSTTITSGDTLSIEDGVEVKFDNGTQLTVSGALVGNGVTFTANSGTSRGAWNRIFTNFTTSWIHLRNSTLQFATDAIYVGAGKVRLDTVTISDSNRGITITQSTNTTINGSAITNTEYPVNIASEGYIAYEGTNDFTGNDNDVVYLSHASNIDVNFTLENPGIPYLPSGTKYVTPGDTLTIKKGNILKFNQNQQLYTQNGGVIIAEGTEAEPIYFTSNRNDNIGGDTNNDGTASVPGNRDWYGITINGKSSKSSFKHVNVSFAGYLPHSSRSDFQGGITLVDNNSPVDSSTFNNNYYGIVLRDSSDAAITNNTIGSSGVVPVALTFDSEPTFTNNSFSSANNEYDAIGLIGTTITGSNYLPKRNFTSIPNVTYLLLRELYVDTGATLEIEPGVVIKSTGSGIRVKGTLTSDGTSADHIIFTSVKDDNVGNPNDTNKDGNNTVPGNRDWRGIALGEDSDASVIDYNEIRYASYNTNFQYGPSGSVIYPRGALNLYNADISITNSDIGNTYEFAIDSRGTSAPTVTNNSFTNTGSVPVALDLSSDPTFSGNTLANAGLVAIGYHGGTFNNDGIIRARTFAGYENITSVLLDHITIASGTKLSIEPGTVIKAQNVHRGLTLRVEGALEAAGTADSVIYFTSIFDDQVGNPLDTNNDGGGSSPGPDNWGTIRFMGTSDDANSELSHSELRYGKHGVIFTDAAPVIDNLTILSCQYYGFGIESGSTVSIQNSLIQNCGFEPVSISSNSNPSFSGITFNGNGSNGINLLESNDLHTSRGVNSSNRYFDTRNTITSNVTISPYSFAGYTNIPYIFRSNWFVGTNATVSVDPSVVFKGNNVVYVDGAFRVLGTKTEPVIFTSYNDDSAGGDSNNDGNNTVPSPGQSAQIQFRASSLDSANLVKNTEFRYPANPIRFINAGGIIDSSLVQLSSGDAIDISGNADPVITNNRFENIGSPSGFSRRHSILMDMFSNPTFSGNVESNVSYKGLGIKGGTWGSDATIPFRSFAGIDSITYHMTAGITIPSGSKITIPDGMVFKRETQYGYWRRKSFNMFTVNGALEVAGSSLNPVVFTNDTDDNFGQPADLYGNGSVDEDDDYKSGNWIIYNATSNDTSNIINNAIFKFGTEALVANSANPTINNSKFEHNQYGISLTGVSAPFVENNIFHDLEFTPLLTSLVSYPQTVSGNEMSGSTYKAIGVRTETLVQDITLEKRDFGGKVGIPYFFTGTYTVGTGAVLTIEPGVVNKFNNSRQLNVQKGLIAEGGSTPDSMIVFTSIFDDFYGGDTNADSNATKPQPGNWLGIKYQGTSLPEVSSLDHTIVKYARGGSSYAGVLADNSSPTITNSIIAENDRGIMVYGSGNPSVTNSDISGNTEFGIFNRDKTFTIDATNNWWGNNSGPTHSTNPTGTGDEVSDGVDFGAFTGSGASNPILGDVSLNGKVQSFDASKILRVAASLDTLNSKQQKVGDVSGNGTVSAMDASYILQYVVGLIEAFPAELNSKSRSDMNSVEGTEDMILSLGASVPINETEFRVPVYIDNVSSLFSSEIEIDFDHSNLELIKSELSDIVNDASVSENHNANGRYSLAIASTKAISESGEVVSLTFRLKDENSSPSLSILRFQANEVDLTATAVSNEDVALNVPDEFNLYQNYPNPFNPSTTIGFDVPNGKTQIRLEIYNILGQRVKTLVNDVYSAGRYKVTWDGTNNIGGRVSTGVYIYRIQAGDIVQSKKLTFIK